MFSCFRQFAFVDTIFSVVCHNVNAIYSEKSIQFVKNTILTDRVFCEKTLYVVFGREKLTLFFIFHGRNGRVIMLNILEQSSEFLKEVVACSSIL